MLEVRKTGAKQTTHQPKKKVVYVDIIEAKVITRPTMIHNPSKRKTKTEMIFSVQAEQRSSLSIYFYVGSRLRHRNS